MRASFSTPWRRVGFAVVCAGLAAGCQLPDVGPFVDATAQLKEAVAMSGRAVEWELRLTPGVEVQADALQAEWEARDRAMAALLAYAQSLDAIVGEGVSGREAAARTADAVSHLAEAVGWVVPGSAPVSTIADEVGTLLYAQIAGIRSARGLRRALEEAQPAVDRIVQRMRQDLRDLDAILLDAHQIVQVTRAREMSDTGLQDQRKAIQGAMRKEWDLTRQEEREELAQLSRLLAEVDARYAAYEAAVGAGAARLRASRQLIEGADAALGTWVVGHLQLVVAARNRTAVSTRALVDASTELRELTGRMRAL